MTINASDSTEVLQLLANLVRINSVNPNYADGTPELACAQFVESHLAKQGIQVWRQEVFSDRPNVLARLPGQNTNRRIVFEAHLDTVSTQGMTIPPLEPTIRDGKLYGRGACDTKAGLAAMIQAVIDLHRQGIQPPCDILLAATIDEEYSYRGVLALCDGMEARTCDQPPIGTPLEAALAVVAEPTELRLVVASKGVLRWKIETIGQAAHSSKPHLGRNAIVAMSRVIEALQADAPQLTATEHPLLGSPTLNIGVIQGGVQVNFVPDRCTIEIDRRLIPGETWQTVYQYYQAIMDKLLASDPALGIVMQPPMLTDWPLDCPVDHPMVGQLSSLLESLRLDGQPLGVPFGSDASKLARLEIPSVILGPGSIDQAHAAVEFVDCQQVIQAVDVYRQIMLRIV
ncbi:MAG: M20 family metallopeptidase [Pirellulaceae bacterium]|nr:M20 family metallopeptidase [Pirellulaceae bacterium]